MKFGFRWNIKHYLIAILAVGCLVVIYAKVAPKIAAPSAIRARSQVAVLQRADIPGPGNHGFNSTVLFLRSGEEAKVVDAVCRWSGPCFYRIMNANGQTGWVVEGDPGVIELH